MRSISISSFSFFQGFSKKSLAPAFSASTATGTEP